MSIKTSIGWAKKTWNPVTGCWGPGGTEEKSKRCFYCYAHRQSKRMRGRFGYPKEDPFKPILHYDKLFQPADWQKPTRVFVCSMADLFGDWVPSSWIEDIITTARRTPRHTYLFLTKNPARYSEFNFPENCWMGATATDQKTASTNMDHLCDQFTSHNIFLSYEPMLEYIDFNKTEMHWLDWIIIGAMTGSAGGRYPVKPEWIKETVGFTEDCGIPIFMKDNLKPYWKYKLIQEWPDERALFSAKTRNAPQGLIH